MTYKPPQADSPESQDHVCTLQSCHGAVVAPLSDVPQEGSSVFSLFSLIKLDLASLPLASSLSRALSLRNLVSGYECGRVFPAGVGPGSPSRDAVNWLPSRFSLSAETRRRFGWLRMMVFPGAHLLRAPQFGALREGGDTREAGSTVAESPVVLYRVGTHQIRRRRRAARSSTSQGRAEPLCARITGLNREVSEGKADV